MILELLPRWYVARFASHDCTADRREVGPLLTFKHHPHNVVFRSYVVTILQMIFVLGGLQKDLRVFAVIIDAGLTIDGKLWLMYLLNILRSPSPHGLLLFVVKPW